jgi:hypothetical protein
MNVIENVRLSLRGASATEQPEEPVIDMPSDEITSSSVALALQAIQPSFMNHHVSRYLPISPSLYKTAVSFIFYLSVCRQTFNLCYNFNKRNHIMQRVYLNINHNITSAPRLCHVEWQA